MDSEPPHPSHPSLCLHLAHCVLKDPRVKHRHLLGFDEGQRATRRVNKLQLIKYQRGRQGSEHNNMRLHKTNKQTKGISSVTVTCVDSVQTLWLAPQASSSSSAHITFKQDDDQPIESVRRDLFPRKCIHIIQLLQATQPTDNSGKVASSLQINQRSCSQNISPATVRILSKTYLKYPDVR